MLNTYKAVLRGNQLEWAEEVPTYLSLTDEVVVYVTILDEPMSPSDQHDQGRKMAEALERLATINALKDITDPVAWEREQRQERPLPDREAEC